MSLDSKQVQIGSCRVHVQVLQLPHSAETVCCTIHTSPSARNYIVRNCTKLSVISDQKSRLKQSTRMLQLTIQNTMEKRTIYNNSSSSVIFSHFYRRIIAFYFQFKIIRPRCFQTQCGKFSSYTRVEFKLSIKHRLDQEENFLLPLYGFSYLLLSLRRFEMFNNMLYRNT